MHLISLWIKEYNVLRDLRIDFSSARTDSERGYGIDFLVGLNGSGKSTVLRLLAEIFTRLERDKASQQSFPFEFEITFSKAFDDTEAGAEEPATKELRGVQERQITITNIDLDDPESPLGERILRVRIGESAEFEPFTDNRLLPDSIVVLTSGQEQDWEHIERLRERRETEQPLAGQLRSSLPSDAEVVGSHVASRRLTDTSENGLTEEVSERLTFIRGAQLPLIMLCSLLDLQQPRAPTSARGTGFNEALAQSSISGMASFSLRFRITDPFDIDPIITTLHHQSRPTRALRLGQDRLLVFNLPLRDGTQRTDAIISQRADEIVKPFGDRWGLFQVLSSLSRSSNEADNILQDVGIILERTSSQQGSGKPPALPEPRMPLHLFSWMSDGEQSFLGRMALLSLLSNRGALILLDEPEVHFNDYWKRQIGYIIHQTLYRTESHILITTHSSIALTDVPSEDIVKIVRRGSYTTGQPEKIAIRTLAADPSDIMVHVFETGYATGEYAVQRVSDFVRPGRTLSAQDREWLSDLQKDIAPGYWSYLIRRALAG